MLTRRRLRVQLETDSWRVGSTLSNFVGSTVQGAWPLRQGAAQTIDQRNVQICSAVIVALDVPGM